MTAIRHASPSLLLALAPFAFCLLGGWPERAAADSVPGVDWHVENAQVAALVQAEGARDAEAFPPPKGQQRVLVREVLKGFDTRQTLLIPAKMLKPGQQAILLIPYQPPPSWEPTLQLKRMGEPSVPTVWPIEGDQVRTLGVPAQTTGKFFEDTPVTMKLVLDEIGRTAPEEPGLYAQLLTASLFPEKLETFIGKDAERIAYVRFVLVVRDLDRDVPALANLLEAQDRKVRDAAIKKLRTHHKSWRESSSATAADGTEGREAGLPARLVAVVARLVGQDA